MTNKPESAAVEAVAWRDDLVSVLESANDASAVPLTWLASTDITPDQVKAWMSETVDNTVAADAFSGELHSIAEDESGQVVAFTGCGPKSAANAKFLIWCAHFVLKHGDSLLDEASALDALRGEVERQSEQMEIVYRYLQKVAPWSESNDMLWCDEVVCGIDGLLQAVADLEADAKRYRWLRDGKAVAPKGDYPVAKSYQHGNTLWNEALDASIDSALTKESP